MKNKNWFWGIVFILGAIFIIATQIGAFGELGLFSAAATVLLAAILIQSLVYLNFFGAFGSLAFLYMIYQKPFDLPFISPWLLLASALLLSIGFSIIFHKRHHHFHPCIGQNNFSSSESIDDNNPYTNVSFSESSKYLHADCLKGGHFSVSFGSLDVYFDQAVLSPEGAEIEINCSFGALKLYVPKEWVVIDKLKTSVGGVENKNRLARPQENSPKLTLTGSVSFAGVEIHYI